MSYNLIPFSVVQGLSPAVGPHFRHQWQVIGLQGIHTSVQLGYDWSFTQPPLVFDNLLEWLRKLRETFIYFTQINNQMKRHKGHWEGPEHKNFCPVEGGVHHPLSMWKDSTIWMPSEYCSLGIFVDASLSRCDQLLTQSTNPFPFLEDEGKGLKFLT